MISKAIPYRHPLVYVFFALLLGAFFISSTSRAFAVTANGTSGTCESGYTYDSQNDTCVQNCPDGSSGLKGCPVGEETGYGVKKPTGTTFAQFVNGPNGVVTFVDTKLIPLLYAIAFLLFLAGMARFFFTGGEENREKGKAFALWGIIGFVVLFGLWGLVNLFLSVIPK